MKKSIFVVTAIWISDNKTAAGGYTEQQLQILEEPWPPERGWIGRSIGRQITLAEKKSFEAERGQKSANNEKKKDFNPNQTRAKRIEEWRGQKKESGKITSQWSDGAISRVLSGLK